MTNPMFKAVLDANVLFPALLRDTLLRAAESGLLQVHWSEDILEELARNLVGTTAMEADNARRLLATMRAEFPESMVDSYERHIPFLRNDPKDRHVVAAAVEADADFIVTFNIRDFAELPDGIHVIQPDSLLRRVLDAKPAETIALLNDQAAFLKRPPATLNQLLERMEKYLKPFATAVRDVLDGEEE